MEKWHVLHAEVGSSNVTMASHATRVVCPEGSASMQDLKSEGLRENQ